MARPRVGRRKSSSSRIVVVFPAPFARGNALKNVLLGSANAVAALAYALFGPVHWIAVLPLGIGFFAGGRLGPVIVRRTPPDALRVVIAVLGLGLDVNLGWHAYR